MLPVSCTALLPRNKGSSSSWGRVGCATPCSAQPRFLGGEVGPLTLQTSPGPGTELDEEHADLSVLT